MSTPRPFLMFTGDATAAMKLYVATFPDSRVVSAEMYDVKGPGPAGTIKVATFTPSNSIFVECETLEVLESAMTSLSQGGQFLMPPGNYGFSKHFCWFNDRFGVSWQLNLAA